MNAAKTGVPRAILFDLDGTLYDSAPDLAASANRLRQRQGLSALPTAAYRAHASAGARGMLKVAFGLSPVDTAYAPLRAEFLEDYAQHLLDHGQPFAGVTELLHTLQAQGIPWAVVTNKTEALTHPIVAHHPWLEAASAVVCGDSTPHPKPHPEPVFEAARRLGQAPQRCVMVGDDLRDIQAGQAAGTATVAARYGYLGVEHPIQAWGAHAIIERPLDLLDWLKRA